MTDRELMQQALDALMAADPDDMVFDAEGHMVFRKDVAINALRNRLAQPEQELMIDCPRCGHCCPRPEQEPVKDRLDFWALFDETQRLRAELKFNTTPPQQWVGLTDEEIKSLPSWWPSYEDAPALIELVKDVEAKLREKNGG
jgi:hypothetical protein